MKRLLCTILIFSMLFGVAACKQTPENTIVIGKNQNEMLEQAQSDENPENQAISLAARYGIPDNLAYQAETNDGKLIINIDAQICVPQENKLPIARVVPADFTQELATRYYQAFCSDKGMLIPPEETTKVQIERSIDYVQAILTDAEAFAGSLYAEEDRPELEKELKDLHKQYAAMPDDQAWLPCDGEIGERTHYNDGRLIYTYTGFEAATMDWQYTFIVENNSDLREAVEIKKDGKLTNIIPVMKHASMRYFDNTNNFGFEIDQGVPSIGATDAIPEKARASLQITPQAAYALITEQLENTDMAIRWLRLGVNEQEQEQFGSAPRYAYIATAARNILGVPCAGFYGMASPNAKAESTYAPTWFYENITIMVDDRGILHFDWSSPYEVTEILQEDAQILSFDKIQDVMESMLPVIHAPQSDTLRLHTVSVHTISLELTRIVEQNSVESGLMIPAWNLYGESVQEYDDNEGGTYHIRNSQKPLISINAIDGSIIDLDRGY